MHRVPQRGTDLATARVGREMTAEADLRGVVGERSTRTKQQFAQRAMGQTSTLQTMSIETATKRWICESCGFIYDPDDGDPDGGIPPGTAFEEIPDTWFCPVCGARKKDFSPYED